MKRLAPFFIAASVFALACSLWFSVSLVHVADAQFSGAVPHSAGTRSVEVLNDGARLFVAPHGKAKKRGLIARGTRLPIVRRLRGRKGDQCDIGYWVQTGQDQYICERHLRASALPPTGVKLPKMAANSLLPHDYVFVGFDGTPAYVHPSDYASDQYYETLGSGFGLVVTARKLFDGVAFVRTRRRVWVEERSVRRARGSLFAGYEHKGTQQGMPAWVKNENAKVFGRRGGRAVRRAGLREVVHVVSSDRKWSELSDGTFMRSKKLASARPTSKPTSVVGSERWLDIDVAQQVLTAYEGTTPVFSTLVSTGRNSKTHATPLGEHRIWIKLAESDMDDLVRNKGTRAANYSIEAVPWVQYFEGSNGLHAAFWHDKFGRRRSHGCINMAPKDAQRIFEFTNPPLPLGWKAIFPRGEEKASIVRVR